MNTSYGPVMSSCVMCGKKRRPMWKDMGDSINRRLEPLRVGLVVLLAALGALGDLGQHRAIARQALAIDHARGIPQLRADDRLGALEVDALDRDRDDTARRLAGEHEAFEQRRICR